METLVANFYSVFLAEVVEDTSSFRSFVAVWKHTNMPLVFLFRPKIPLVRQTETLSNLLRTYFFSNCSARPDCLLRCCVAYFYALYVLSSSVPENFFLDTAILALYTTHRLAKLFPKVNVVLCGLLVRRNVCETVYFSKETAEDRKARRLYKLSEWRKRNRPEKDSTELFQQRLEKIAKSAKNNKDKTVLSKLETVENELESYRQLKNALSNDAEYSEVDLASVATKYAALSKGLFD